MLPQSATSFALLTELTLCSIYSDVISDNLADR